MILLTENPEAPSPETRPYCPMGSFRELWQAKDPEILLEGPAGTGKTRGRLEQILYFCGKYPGSRHLMARATRAAMTESVLVTWENKVVPFGWLDGNAGRANRHSYTICGSEVVVGGLDNPDRILSTEYDTINVFEATETVEDAIEKLNTRLRNNVMPFQQLCCDCNPGPPNHWLNARAARGQMRRIKTRHVDNPSLTPAYLLTLSKLSGHRRRRLFLGEWCAAEGGVFPEFNETHIAKPFDVQDWPCYLSIDPGFAHPCAICVLACGPGDHWFIVDEWVKTEQGIASVAAAIADFRKRYNIIRLLGDPHDAFKRTLGSNGRTIADQLGDHGHILGPAPAANNRAELNAQVTAMRTAITTQTALGPKLKVFDRCTAIIAAFQSWQFARNTKGELTGSEDDYEEAYKDEMDAVRMIIATNPTHDQPSVASYERGKR